MHDEDNEWLQPGPEITEELFRQWQTARRGSSPAHDMTNPVWEWLFRGRIAPYHANEYFRSRTAKSLGTTDFPAEPRWAGCRLGQSHTKLADGREIWIAGEHEDYYDPDFFIYNDVIVRHPDERLQIFGYPESTFRPTDFHSATLTRDESSIIIIGSIGYPDHRREGYTQVYRLSTRDYSITEVPTTGDHPGWINKHAAKLTEHGDSIIVSGGEVQIGETMIESIDDWSLNLAEGVWARLTDRKWPRFVLGREDGESLHLWQYEMLEMSERFPELGSADFGDLASEIGTTPKLDVYRSLFRPAVGHRVIEKSDEEHEDKDWRTTEVVIDGIHVRFVDDMGEVKVVVEGDLRESVVEVLLRELREKLSAIENSPCSVKRIG